MCSYNVDEYQTHTSTLLKQRTLVLASIFAPLSNNSRTMFVFPLLDATCNGVIPFCKKGDANNKRENFTEGLQRKLHKTI